MCMHTCIGWHVHMSACACMAFRYAHPPCSCSALLQTSKDASVACRLAIAQKAPVCTYAHMYACTRHTYTYTYARMYACTRQTCINSSYMWVYACTWTWPYADMQTCRHADMQTARHGRMDVCCMHICTYVDMHAPAAGWPSSSILAACEEGVG